MYDAILIPTDGSEGAETAARHGLALARAFEGEVHLLSVVDERSYSRNLADLDPAVEEQRDAVERRAAEAVEALEATVAEASVPCRSTVERGIPHEAIREYVAAHGIDLVAMGTHGRTGLDRLLLGSVTERVVRTSDVPVLTSRPGDEQRSGYDRVLVPTDGSEQATAAVEHAVAVAERFGATVHALSVVETRALAGVYDAGAGVPDLLESLEERCRQAVGAVEEQCADRDVEVVADVTQGAPYSEIREYVAAHGIDLIAMGTHGRTGLDRYLVGSVTERVVRTSDVPVLTVR